MKDKFNMDFLEEDSIIMDNVENDIYSPDFVDRLLENDALTFEEAAFMTGYSDFS